MKKTAILLCAMLLSAASASSQNIWNVYEDGSGDAPTIAAAADSASNGDWILIHGGTYHEQNIIFDGKDVNVDVFGGEAVYLVAPVHRTGECLIINDATSNFLLHSLYIEGYATAVTTMDASPVIEYITIGDCAVAVTISGHSSPTFAYSVVDSSLTAISVMSTQDVTLRNLTIVGCTNGIVLNSGNILITRCILYGNNTGISCGSATVDLACNNLHANGVDYSGCSPGPDDFFLDPLFCFQTPSPPYPYLLHEDSPCLPATSPCGLGMWLGFSPTVGCSGEGTEEESWGGIKSLFR
jgi:hypothetical protein